MSVSSISSTKINGLSSGLDTESIVKSMLAYDQAKVDKQFQNKTKLEWKRDAYRDVNTALKNFRQSNMSVLNSSTNMLSNAAYNTYTTSMLTTTSAVSVSAGSTATTGKMTINQITQLASAATVKSSGIFSGDTVAYDTALSELDFTNAITFEDDEIAFSINGKEFNFSKDDTLSTVINKINADADAGVKINYSSLTKGFTISSKQTGASSKVDIVNLKGNAFASTDSAFGIAQGTNSGKNAMLTIENVAVERESNSFTIDGITYNLKDKTDTAVSFNVDRDLDATMTKIKDFVKSYNELIGSLQSMLDETVKYNYDPLTDDQREELTEDEAKKWDTSAKSGMLRNDSTISSLITTLRSAFYTTVEGTGMSAADIGITTGSWSDKGKIVIDETKLRSALENNPDAVTNLFTNTSTSTDGTTRFNNSGLVTRISTAMINCTSTLSSVSLANLDTNISTAEDRLSELEDRMAEDEEAFWAKMTALETAMSSMNSQSTWLSSQLSALG